MAEVIPFRGVVYNPDAIGDLSKVVAPACDVISTAELDHLYRLHPKNICRLILNRSEAGEAGDKARHQRAASLFHQWLHEGTLQQDERPAFYVTAVAFPSGGRTATRYGVIANVRLEPFENGIIRPHEKTIPKVSSERLGLMQACHANFSPIFSVFSDRHDIMARLIESVSRRSADMDVVNAEGLRHRLWRITDPDTLGLVCRGMADRRLTIAEGHHRYEAALAYREWLAQKAPDFDEEHPSNFVMMALASLQDPGLVILPVHRLLKQVPALLLETAMSQAEPYFDITSIPAKGDFGRASGRFHEAVANKGDGTRTTIGVYGRGGDFRVLRIRPGVMKRLFGHELDAAMRQLDVTVLTRLVFMQLMHLDASRLDKEKMIGYRTDAVDAVAAVAEGRYDAAFVLNPARMAQVQTVRDAGLIMPRKSTCFYPQDLSGRVLNLLTTNDVEADKHLELNEELLTVLGAAGYRKAEG
jgi:uncharacterized protein (DUF1015 family)